MNKEKLKNLNKQEDSTSNQENIEKKQKKWKEKEQEINKIKDYFGEEIEKGVKQAVVAFNLNGLPTRQSCEGHIEGGLPFPWIDIASYGEPEQRFENEKEVFKSIADKYDLSYEEIKRSISPEGKIVDKINKAHKEAKEKVCENKELKDYKEWRQKNKELENKVKDLINEFYKDRKVSKDIKIKINIIGPGNIVRVYSGPKNKENRLNKKELKKKLKNRQKEIKDFSYFLKKRFFKD